MIRYHKNNCSRKLEPNWLYLGQICETIINKGNSWSENEKNVEVLNKEEKKIFAQLIAIQYLRMPDIREKYSDARKKSDDLRLDIIKGFLSHENPELKDTIENIHGEYDKTFDPILHLEIFADEEIFLGIANQIINKHWIFYFTPNNDFFTSDNPVLIKPHIQNQSPYYEGFGMRGAEIIFPISSSILLTIWDENYFENIKYNIDSFNKISMINRIICNTKFSPWKEHKYFQSFFMVTFVTKI